MKHGYTNEKNIQILIALLKAHGIKKVIASPGATNLTFVASIMYDQWFELYSCVDERSAAYMACGLAAESGEAVCLSCTGATASRNYIPGLTEAYYRKLPVLALTASQPVGRIGQNVPQMVDRTQPLNDIVTYSCTLPFVHTAEDRWDCELKVNAAILALKRRGGGPAHINMQQNYSRDFSCTELPNVRVIRRFAYTDELPALPHGKICVWVGNHKKMDAALTQAIDDFCGAYNAAVFVDHTSGYYGAYRLNYSLAACQLRAAKETPDLMVYIGDVSGAYYGGAKQVWRVHPDGEFRDVFRTLSTVFEMDETYFFRRYAECAGAVQKETSYRDELCAQTERIRLMIPDVPFSNLWCAKETAARIPGGACVHLGILNSLRCWNFFEFAQGVEGYSNTGGFGIDGGLSSCIGACLASPERLHFLVIGDLAFFYDMNVLGNRHVLRNLRVLLVNNGRGTEFRNFDHPGAAFGSDADAFIAAAGHFGNQSRALVKHYANDLGCEYLSAANKEEYRAGLERFLCRELTERPMVFEVFTDWADESSALETVKNLDTDAVGSAKLAAKKILGDKGVRTVKKLLGRQ